MNKFFFIGIILLVLITGIVLANSFNQTIERDIPYPLNPEFVNKIESCGKLDLIDRASVNYNSKALIDGSLTECDN
jgi:hypothetical protein